nr:nuclear transport factor 2 family protein [Sphingomonas laterariae]
MSIASLSAVKARQREAWLALFADDAVVEDPVGRSPFDPVGQGHRGKQAIGAFYDNVIAKNKTFEFVIRESYLCGQEVASVARFFITGPDDVAREVDLVTVHRINDAGKLVSLRAFWEFPGLNG